MKKNILLFAFFLLIFPSLQIWAAPVGELSLEKGLVKVRRNNIDTVYRDPGQTVFVENKDEIQTGFNSKVIIKLTGKDEAIELYSASFFVVTAVDQEQSEVFLPTGKARFKVTARKPLKRGRRRFRLRTANALIGVKGTEFVVGASDGDTSLLTLSGSVSFASLAAPDIEVEVGANQASKIKQANPPTVPVVVPPKVREEVIESDSPEAFDNVEFSEETIEPEVSEDKKDEETEETEEEVVEEPEPEVEDVIEEVDNTLSDLQDELEESQLQQKSIKFKIVDE